MKSTLFKQRQGKRLAFEMEVPNSRLQKMLGIFNAWGGADCEIISEDPNDYPPERPGKIRLRVRVSVSAVFVFKRICDREELMTQQVVNE